MNGRTPTRDILALLTAAEAAPLLQLAIIGRADVELADFEHRITGVHHRPGADTSVRFEVRYRLVDAAREAQLASVPHVTDHVIITTNAAASGGDGVVELRHGDDRLYAWRPPADPALPAVAAALDRATFARWLREAGEAGADDSSAFAAEVVGHRPLRRATLRVRTSGAEYFVKTVRHRDAAALVRRHRVAADSGIGPELVAAPMPGTIVIRAATGEPLARAIAAAREGGAAPSPASFIALLDRLPAEALDLPRRTPWSERLDFHSRAARDAHPELATRVAALRGRLAARLAASPTGPVVPTHGDPYVANVFVEDGVPTQLIDLDALGPGYRVDDLATALAHLAVLPALAPEVYPHVGELVGEWRRSFEAQPGIDAVALRARVAAVLVSLMAGARPDQAAARLELAESWCELAGTPDLEVARPTAPSGREDRAPRPGDRWLEPITIPHQLRQVAVGTFGAGAERDRSPVTPTRRHA